METWKQSFSAARKLLHFLNYGHSVLLFFTFVSWNFVALLIGKKKTSKTFFGEEFKCRLYVLPCLLINPTVWSSGSSRVRGLFLLSGQFRGKMPVKSICLHLVFCLEGWKASLWASLSGYFVVAVGTVHPASHFVAKGWDSAERTSLVNVCSFAAVPACSFPVSCPLLPFWKEWAYPRRLVIPALLSVHQACSSEPVSDWVRFKSYSLLFR